jgi:hypothetical protein
MADRMTASHQIAAPVDDAITALGAAEAERLLEERREQTGRYFTEEKERQLRTLTAARSDSAA